MCGTEMLQLEKGITHAAKAAENGKWQVSSGNQSGPSVCRSSSAGKTARLTSLRLANHFIDPRIGIEKVEKGLKALSGEASKISHGGLGFVCDI